MNKIAIFGGVDLGFDGNQVYLIGDSGPPLGHPVISFSEELPSRNQGMAESQGNSKKRSPILTQAKQKLPYW